MPDMERVTDDLMLFVSSLNNDDYMYAKGYIDGKNAARKQVVYVFVFIVMIYSIIVIYSGW